MFIYFMLLQSVNICLDDLYTGTGSMNFTLILFGTCPLQMTLLSPHVYYLCIKEG